MCPDLKQRTLQYTKGLKSLESIKNVWLPEKFQILPALISNAVRLPILLKIRNRLSKDAKIINNWLKAFLIFFCIRTMQATKLPESPKVATHNDITPVKTHWRFKYSWNKDLKGWILSILAFWGEKNKFSSVWYLQPFFWIWYVW